MTGFIKEFKDFISKGNVVDMAVGVIIAAVFGAVVTSAVQDLFMPPLGYVLGGVDFSDKVLEVGTKKDAVGKELVLDKDGKTEVAVESGDPRKRVPAVAIRYGKFINTVIALAIQGFALFLVIKAMARLKRSAPAPAGPPPPTRDQELLTEIRDLLKRSAQ